MHVSKRMFADFGVPQYSSLVPSLERAEDPGISRPLVYSATYCIMGRKQLFEVRREEKPRNQGERRRNMWGPDLFRSGQLCGQGRYGSTRLQRLDLASRHTYGSRVQPKLARSRRPTNEAMNLRKKDWMGVTKGIGSLPPPSTDAGCTFSADELASGCRARDEV